MERFLRYQSLCFTAGGPQLEDPARFAAEAVHAEGVLADLHDGIGRRVRRFDHALEIEVVDAGLLRVAARVVVAADVGGHAAVLLENRDHFAVVPEVVLVVRMNGKVAEDEMEYMVSAAGAEPASVQSDLTEYIENDKEAKRKPKKKAMRPKKSSSRKKKKGGA